MKCVKCNQNIEVGDKFCTNCGEQILLNDNEVKKDISGYFFLLTVITGFIPALLRMRIELNLIDMSFGAFVSEVANHINGEIIGGLIGYSIGTMMLPSIIVGIIWFVKKIQSKPYMQPKLLIIIGTLIMIAMLSVHNAG